MELEGFDPFCLRAASAALYQLSYSPSGLQNTISIILRRGNGISCTDQAHSLMVKITTDIQSEFSKVGKEFLNFLFQQESSASTSIPHRGIEVCRLAASPSGRPIRT